MADVKYCDMRLLHRIEMCVDPRRRKQSVQRIASHMQIFIYPHGMKFVINKSIFRFMDASKDGAWDW